MSVRAMFSGAGATRESTSVGSRAQLTLPPGAPYEERATSSSGTVSKRPRQMYLDFGQVVKVLNSGQCWLLI